MREIMTVSEYNAKQTLAVLKYPHTDGFVVAHYNVSVSGGIFQYCKTIEEAEQVKEDGIDY